MSDTTRIAPMLAVSNGAAAIEFYKSAFGAVELWRIDAGGSVVAGLTVDGAEFFLADANPPKTIGPDAVGGTTVRIELFVDDPGAALARAVAAGATDPTPVTEHSHTTVAGSIFRMLQGGVKDPFGHTWLIGKFLV
jgi:PhnB protein